MKLLIILATALVLFMFVWLSLGESAYVTFSGAAPKKYESDSQPLTLYGCNNTKVAHNMQWSKSNKKEIPYGHQSNDGKDYFISKYYVASPPLPNTFSPDQPLILGVLSKDHFSLTEADQNVDIVMDYTLLKPIELGFLTVDYSHEEDGVASCLDQEINVVPINIRCPSFEYASGGKTGLGKGIAQLDRNAKDGVLGKHGKLFIPLNVESKVPLEGCTVEVLNDIILEHEVFFGTPDNHQEKINLTQAYNAFNSGGKNVMLYCKARAPEQKAKGCNAQK